MEKTQDLINYYDNLREQSKSIKYNEFKNIFHHLANPIAMRLNKGYAQRREEMAFGYKRKRIVLGRENLPKQNALYIANHASVSDVSSLYEGIRRQAYLMADANQQQEKDTSFFNSLVGVVYVKRCLTDEEEQLIKIGEYEVPEELSGKHAKLFFINRLLHKENCAMFFEGTWNNSPNDLVLPTKWGAVEIALAGKAPIVPVTIEYLVDLDTEIISVGNPIYVNELSDKQAVNEEIRGIIAKTRFEILEKYSRASRRNISAKDFDEFLIKNYMAYPDMPIMEEMKCIRTYDDFDAEKRLQQYKHLLELQQEALRRATIIEDNNGLKKTRKKK